MLRISPIKAYAVFFALSLGLLSSKAALSSTNEYQALIGAARQFCLSIRIEIREQLATIQGIKTLLRLRTSAEIEQHLEEIRKLSTDPARQNQAFNLAYIQCSYINALHETRQELIEFEKIVGAFLEKLPELHCCVEDLQNKINHVQTLKKLTLSRLSTDLHIHGQLWKMHEWYEKSNPLFSPK